MTATSLLRFLVVLAAWNAPSRAEGGGEPRVEEWQSDVTDSMSIGPTLTGYKHVSLRCGADHMDVEVEMEDDFDGVLYTRGAYHSRKAPCFLDADGGHNFTLRLPFASCNTRRDNGVYSNTIVIQYDDELIMPGDAAFKLECNTKILTDYTVSSRLNSEGETMSSHISLEDADPGANGNRKSKSLSASSKSSSVTFNPQNAKLRLKEEL